MRNIRLIRQPDGSWEPKDSRAFPGYLFADTKDIDYLRDRLRKIPELTKVIGAGDEIFPVYEEEEELLRLLGGKDHIITPSKAHRSGNKIVVTSGSLVGMERLISWTNAHQKKAEISVTLSGRTARVRVGLEVFDKTRRNQVEA